VDICGDDGRGVFLLVMLHLLQEVVVGGRNSRVQVLDLSKEGDLLSTTALNAPTRERAQESQGPKSRPWLMPHQLGNLKEARYVARKQARAVNAGRSPSGGFAVFDLPPKF
jgi:hypothetical protein